jgi:Na+/phosphate symporter
MCNLVHSLLHLRRKEARSTQEKQKISRAEIARETSDEVEFLTNLLFIDLLSEISNYTHKIFSMHNTLMRNSHRIFTFN